MQTRRVILILVTRAVQVLLFAGIAKAQASSFIANFDAFDANRWSKGDHRLSRSYLDPTKVSVSNRKLQIKLPGSSLDGEELVSNSLYGYSSQSARMKPPNASTSITGFSLRDPLLRERDRLEFYSDSSERITITTYAGGVLTKPRPCDYPTTRPRRAPRVALRLRAGSGTF